MPIDTQESANGFRIKPDSFVTPSELFTKEPKPFEESYSRRCFRVLRMISVLHGKGFHGLRVFPYVYPLAYRLELYPAMFTAKDGVKFQLSGDVEAERLVARHSGANEARFFGWEDATDLSAHALAVLFIERFPHLSRAAYHLDYAYAGWFATLLAHCEYGYLPYLFGEYENEIGAMRLRHVGQKQTDHRMEWFPLPPGPSGGFAMDPQPTPIWMQE
jgi:hypothetical protein